MPRFKVYVTQAGRYTRGGVVFVEAENEEAALDAAQEAEEYDISYGSTELDPQDYVYDVVGEE